MGSTHLYREPTYPPDSLLPFLLLNKDEESPLGPAERERVPLSCPALIRAGRPDGTQTAVQDPMKQRCQKEGARREQLALDAAAPPPSSTSAPPHEQGSESQGARRHGRGSERQRVQYPGSLSPSVSWTCPTGAPTAKLVSATREAPKMPRKKPPLSG